MINHIRNGLLTITVVLAGCTQAPAPTPPDTRAADEATIRAAITDWDAAARGKDAEKFVSVYAPNAAVMLANAPDLHGSDAIRDGISGMMQDPNFALTFSPDNVVASRSGDLAYETGVYSLTMSDEEKNPVTESGHYVVVWQKQPDGLWKVVIDAPVSDPPAGEAS